MQVIKGSINSKQHIDAVKRQHDKHVNDKQKNAEQNSTSNTYDDDFYDVDADLEAFSDTIDDMLDALDNRRCTNGYLRYEEDRQPKLVCRRTPHMLGEFGLDEDVPLTIGAWHLVRAIVDKDVVSDAHDVGIDVIVPAVSEHDADRVASRLQIFRDIVNHIPGAEIVIRHDRIEHVIPDFAAVQVNFVPPQSADRKFRMFRD